VIPSFEDGEAGERAQWKRIERLASRKGSVRRFGELLPVLFHIAWENKDPEVSDILETLKVYVEKYENNRGNEWKTSLETYERAVATRFPQPLAPVRPVKANPVKANEERAVLTPQETLVRVGNQFRLEGGRQGKVELGNDNPVAQIVLRYLNGTDEDRRELYWLEKVPREHWGTLLTKSTTLTGRLEFELEVINAASWDMEKWKLLPAHFTQADLEALIAVIEQRRFQLGGDRSTEPKRLQRLVNILQSIVDDRRYNERDRALVERAILALSAYAAENRNVDIVFKGHRRSLSSLQRELVETLRQDADRAPSAFEKLLEEIRERRLVTPDLACELERVPWTDRELRTFERFLTRERFTDVAIAAHVDEGRYPVHAIPVPEIVRHLRFSSVADWGKVYRLLTSSKLRDADGNGNPYVARDSLPLLLGALRESAEASGLGHDCQRMLIETPGD
jgi:hypothetical protein